MDLRKTLCLGVALLFVFAAAPSLAEGRAPGKLVVSVKGLPKWQPAAVTIYGPKGKTYKMGMKRRLVIKKRGKWKVIARPVRTKKSFGSVAKGAKIKPERRKRVARPSHGKRVVVRYTTIINPGVRQVGSEGVASIEGDQKNPSTITFSGKRNLRSGQIISSQINNTFPYGLLSRVVDVSHSGGNTKVTLQKASVFEAMPRARFRTKIASARLRSLQRAKPLQLSCSSPNGEPVASTIAFEPFIENIEARGEWNTIEIFGQDTGITSGATVVAAFDVGLKTSLSAQKDFLSCSASFELATIPFAIAGVPAYIAPTMGGKLKFSVNTALSSTTRARIEVGAEIDAPSTAKPILRARIKKEPSNLALKLSASLNASVSAGLAIGVGVNGLADMAVTGSSSLDVTYQPSAPQPRRCGVDLNPAAIGVSATAFDIFSAEQSWNAFEPIGLYTWDECEEKEDPLLPPAPYEGSLTDETSIAAGFYHSCMISSRGEVLCLGKNDQGQIGNNKMNEWNHVKVPTRVFRNARQVTAGESHSCAIHHSRELFCWGDNGYGQLSIGEEIPNKTAPVAVVGIDNVRQVSAGGNHTCAIRYGGELFCWGKNSSGQLGTGDLRNRRTPTKVLDNVLQVSSGGDHTCATMTVGTVFCWGNNKFSQAGSNTPGYISKPVRVIGLGNVTQVSAGIRHSCAVREMGTAFCWGANGYGQLGVGDEKSRTKPTLVSGPQNIRQIAAGETHSCSVSKTYKAFCWGRGGPGHLGHGGKYSTSVPVQVVGVNYAKQITTGMCHTCASESNVAFCWGNDNAGQLGGEGSVIRPTSFEIYLKSN